MQTIKSIVVIQKALTNPEEVNAADSWDVAKFERKTVAMANIDGHMDVFEALEFAYLKTQHIAGSWFEDRVWEFTQESRSTMVGDWIIVDGEAYEVEGFGFKKVEDVLSAA